MGETTSPPSVHAHHKPSQKASHGYPHSQEPRMQRSQLNTGTQPSRCTYLPSRTHQDINTSTAKQAPCMPCSCEMAMPPRQYMSGFPLHRHQQKPQHPAHKCTLGNMPRSAPISPRQFTNRTASLPINPHVSTASSTNRNGACSGASSLNHTQPVCFALAQTAGLAA